MRQPRIRMFAGPNGSGKSTLFDSISSKFNAGYFINSDLIEKEISSKGFIDLDRYELKLTEKDFEDLQALMMIDMDYFKQINDTYGHATGDQVLKIFAGFLKEQFRATDIIGRVGGDEFMILMKNVRLDYSIHLHLQKLYTNLQNIDIPELNGRKLSCSIGCAVAPTDAESFSQLYRLADHALYTAKHNGRGRFVIYHDIKNQQETVLS